MDQLLNGPMGNIVAAGLQALVGGIPLGKNGANALLALRNGGIAIPPECWLSPKLSEQEKVQQTYETMEIHLNGALRILKPAMEITNILTNECKSADRLKPNISSSSNLQYYTPQEPLKPEVSCSTSQTNKKIEASPAKLDVPIIKLEKTSSKSAKINGKSKELKKTNNIIQNNAKCSACYASKKNMRAPVLIPCGHFSCYKCLPNNSTAECRKCHKKYRMKDVTKLYK